MASVVQDRPLPKTEAFVRRQLEETAGRIRSHDLANASMGLALLVIAYGLVAVALDRWLGLPSLARQTLFLGFLAGSGWYIWRIWLPPLLARVNPYYAARQIERQHGDAKNSVINYLDLQNAPLPASIRQALHLKAARDFGNADIERATHDPLVAYLTGATITGIGIALAFMLLLRPMTFFSHLGRAFAPFGSTAVVQQTTLTIVEPASGEVTLPVDQSLNVLVQVEGRVPKTEAADALRIRFRYQPDEPAFEERRLESTLNNGIWQARIPAVEVRNGLWYRITGGDTETPEYRVQVRSSPSITDYEVRYTFRPYVGLADEIRTDPHIQAVRGTVATIRTKTNREVLDGSLRWVPITGGTQNIPGERVANQPETLEFRLPLEADGQYRVSFKSVDGDRNREPMPYPVKLLSDRPPNVELLAPLPEKLPVNGTLTVRGRATDDFGVAAMRLHLATLSSEKSEQRSPLPPKAHTPPHKFLAVDGKPLRTVDYRDFVPLAELKDAAGQPIVLRPGMVLEYFLEAEDACDSPKPNLGRSLTQRVLLVDALTPPERDADKQKNEGEQQKHDGQPATNDGQPNAGTPDAKQPDKPATPPKPDTPKQPDTRTDIKDNNSADQPQGGQKSDTTPKGGQRDQAQPKSGDQSTQQPNDAPPPGKQGDNKPQDASNGASPNDAGANDGNDAADRNLQQKAQQIADKLNERNKGQQQPNGGPPPDGDKPMGDSSPRGDQQGDAKPGEDQSPKNSGGSPKANGDKPQTGQQSEGQQPNQDNGTKSPYGRNSQPQANGTDKPQPNQIPNGQDGQQKPGNDGAGDTSKPQPQDAGGQKGNDGAGDASKPQPKNAGGQNGKNGSPEASKPQSKDSGDRKGNDGANDAPKQQPKDSSGQKGNEVNGQNGNSDTPPQSKESGKEGASKPANPQAKPGGDKNEGKAQSKAGATSGDRPQKPDAGGKDERKPKTNAEQKGQLQRPENGKDGESKSKPQQGERAPKANSNGGQDAGNTKQSTGDAAPKPDKPEDGKPGDDGQSRAGAGTDKLDKNDTPGAQKQSGGKPSPTQQQKPAGSDMERRTGEAPKDADAADGEPNDAQQPKDSQPKDVSPKPAKSGQPKDGIGKPNDTSGQPKSSDPKGSTSKPKDGVGQPKDGDQPKSGDQPKADQGQPKAGDQPKDDKSQPKADDQPKDGSPRDPASPTGDQKPIDKNANAQGSKPNPPRGAPKANSANENNSGAKAQPKGDREPKVGQPDAGKPPTPQEKADGQAIDQMKKEFPKATPEQQKQIADKLEQMKQQSKSPRTKKEAEEAQKECDSDASGPGQSSRPKPGKGNSGMGGDGPGESEGTGKPPKPNASDKTEPGDNGKPSDRPGAKGQPKQGEGDGEDSANPMAQQPGKKPGEGEHTGENGNDGQRSDNDNTKTPDKAGGGPGNSGARERAGTGGHFTDTTPGIAPDAKHAGQSGDLQLERLKKVDKKTLDELKMSLEEYQQFLKAYEAMLKRKAATAGKTDRVRADTKGGSAANSGAAKVNGVKGDGKDTIEQSGTLTAPPEFAEIYKNFTAEQSKKPAGN